MEGTSREERLEDVIRDLAELREEWERLGRPKLMRNANLNFVPHPLLKLIRESEELIERMSRPLEAARGGRPKGSGSAPDRVMPAGPPKRTRLEAVS
jgi:hypothetical protein